MKRNGKIKSSEKIIQKSLDISNNSYPYILNYLAYLWVDNNRNLDKAEKMLIKAVEDSNYQDGAIIDSLGWLYFKKGEMQLAEKWITDAYKLEPSEPEIIDHLSQVYKKQGRNKEAKFLDNKILLFHQDYFKIDEIKELNLEHLPQKINEEKYRENLLDLTAASGIETIWIENNSSCKHLCYRIKNINFVTLLLKEA